MSRDITPAQARVLAFIRDAQRAHGRPPTLREMCARFGWKSDNAARQHLRLLERKGALTHDPRTARGLRLPPSPLAPGAREAPLLGRVPAGPLLEAAPEVERRVAVDPVLFPEEGLFLLRVRGRSMSGAGILDGDLVLVRPCPAPEPGRIVVAMVEGEATLKRLAVREGRVVLAAEDPASADIPLPADRESGMVGEVVGVIRRM